MRDIAEQLGLSERSVHRRFVAEFGVPPRVFLRLIRVRTALRLVQEGCSASLAELALASGFSDQAHLARELHALAGFTPSAMQTARVGDPLRSWPLQTAQGLLVLA